MNLITAINQLYRDGAVQYRPMGGQIGCSGVLYPTEGTIILHNWTDMSEMQLKKAVKSFYEDNADYFADGYWLSMYEENGALVMEVCDEA